MRAEVIMRRMGDDELVRELARAALRVGPFATCLTDSQHSHDEFVAGIDDLAELLVEVERRGLRV